MIWSEPFGQINGHKIEKITMQNAQGMQISCITYGCIITKILVADQFGTLENVVLSFDSLNEYLQQPQFFGAVIGRFAGRLEDSKIRVANEVIQLTPNEGKHLLHGGKYGFHNQIWDVSTGIEEGSPYIEFTLEDKLSEFPGTLQMTVKYILTDKNDFIIQYNGFCDQDTLLNCTNHSYFNLSGNLRKTIHNHTLQLCSKKMLPLNKEGVPLGDFIETNGTVFDFNTEQPLFKVLSSTDEQVVFASNGLDHPFLLEERSIMLKDYRSGRQLTVLTDEPSIVIYTGNKIGNDYDFSNGSAKNYLGICLETQKPPNSVKYLQLQSSLLRKNEVYNSSTIYRFSLIDIERKV